MTSRRSDPALTADRDALLEAMLPDIPFDGWTVTTMRSAAERAGLAEGAVSDLFPGGAAEAAAWFADWCDRRMLERLEALPLDEMKVRNRIALALTVRLEVAYPHREAVSRALAVLAQPFNAPRALASLHATVDAIWYAAGDTATDINWYTKRALLAGVYGSVLLYWLNDRSEEFADTRRFIERRIDDIMRLSRLTRPLSGGPLDGIAKRLPLARLLERLTPFGRRHRMRV